MKPTTMRPSATQALLLSMCFAMLICWGDTVTKDDYGIASLYVVAVIFTRWFGNGLTATAIIVWVVAAEVYTNAYIGAYTYSFTQGRGWAVALWGMTLHAVAFTAVTLTIRWIRDLVTREQEANRLLVNALREVHELESLLPICSYCKKIRDDAGNWQRIESYIADRTGASFTHGCCPECKDEVLADFRKSKS